MFTRKGGEKIRYKRPLSTRRKLHQTVLIAWEKK